uniref:Uncharacterized protein n=1 Tax=Chenopodium quinoa TaxID=63459 RepID=A0A803L3H2_CHEQI
MFGISTEQKDCIIGLIAHGKIGTNRSGAKWTADYSTRIEHDAWACSYHLGTLLGLFMHSLYSTTQRKEEAHIKMHLHCLHHYKMPLHEEKELTVRTGSGDYKKDVNADAENSDSSHLSYASQMNPTQSKDGRGLNLISLPSEKRNSYAYAIVKLSCLCIVL